MTPPQVLKGRVYVMHRNPREPRNVYVGEIKADGSTAEKIDLFRFESKDVMHWDRTALNVGDRVSFLSNGLYAVDIRLVAPPVQDSDEKEFWEHYMRNYPSYVKPRELVLIERPRDV